MNQSSGMRLPQAELILWDIMEEHLEETGYLWGQWEAALDAPDYTLAEVAEVEERLFAHVDGLLVGGPPVAERLLLPALADDDPELVFAAAYSLLSSGVADLADAVVGAMVEADEDQLPAIKRALELAPLDGLERRLRTLATKGKPPVRAAALDALTFHGLEVGGLLTRFLAIKNPVLLQAGLRAARLPGALLLEEHLRRAMDHSNPEVRDAALEAGLIRGLPAAKERCQALAASRDPGCGHALLLLALAGDERDHELIRDCRKMPKLRAAVIWAMGYSVRVSAAELCLRAIDTEDGDIARLAGEAFCSITGLDLEGEGFVAPGQPSSRQDPCVEGAMEPQEDELEELAPQTPEQMLLRPDCCAVRAWWKEHREQFKDGVRYLYGSPMDKTSLLQALRHAPTRRRHPLALAVTLRTRGAQLLQTRAWSGLQWEQIRRMSSLDPAVLADPPADQQERA